MSPIITFPFGGSVIDRMCRYLVSFTMGFFYIVTWGHAEYSKPTEEMPIGAADLPRRLQVGIETLAACLGLCDETLCLIK